MLNTQLRGPEKGNQDFTPRSQNGHTQKAGTSLSSSLGLLHAAQMSLSRNSDTFNYYIFKIPDYVKLCRKENKDIIYSTDI